MQIPNIIKGIKFLWTRLDLIGKNNIYFQRVQTHTTSPYMKINCRVDDVEVVNNGECNLVTYTVGISVWGDDSMGNSDIISSVINSMMGNLVSLPYTTGFLHCISVNDSIMLDEDTKLGSDVLITNSSWTLMFQENR